MLQGALLSRGGPADSRMDDRRSVHAYKFSEHHIPAALAAAGSNRFGRSPQVPFRHFFVPRQKRNAWYFLDSCSLKLLVFRHSPKSLSLEVLLGRGEAHSVRADWQWEEST